MSAIDRRELLIRTGQVALAGTAIGALAGCGSDGGSASTAASTAAAPPKPTTTTPAKPAKPNVAELRKLVKGTVFTKTTPGFTKARTIYNSAYADVVPLAVVRVASVADVQATVKWAAEYGVPITARSGGHSYGGYSSVEKGVVVDVRRLNGIQLGNGTAKIGAGANLWEVYSTLANKGVSTPGGSCPTVGFAGLAQGGGMGLASRKHGLTIDAVQGANLVTADGATASATSGGDEDLYWALRGGGGGNFGIATSFTVKTFPVDQAAYAFISWPWSAAGEVLAAWQDFAPNAPDELTTICSLLTTTGDSPQVTVIGQYFGSESGLNQALAPLLKAAPGGQVSTGTADYLDLIQRWAGCLGKSAAECAAYAPTAFAAKSSYVTSPFTQKGTAAAVSALEARQGQPGSGSLIFDSYGGAISRVAPTATAFAHRDVVCCIQYLAYYPPGAADTANGWLKTTRAALDPYVSQQAYQNYIDPKLENYQAAYYAQNLPRLRTIKAKYDPNDLFRFPKGIVPAKS
jgi:FAD/FMN-containing dehydrogenase